MANKQVQIEMEDETTVVRILSGVFMTLMLLIIVSYSETPQAQLSQQAELSQQTAKTETSSTITQFTSASANITAAAHTPQQK